MNYRDYLARNHSPFYIIIPQSLHFPRYNISGRRLRVGVFCGSRFRVGEMGMGGGGEKKVIRERKRYEET